MLLEQLDATDRQHHADAQAKNQAGAVSENGMIAVVIDKNIRGSDVIKFGVFPSFPWSKLLAPSLSHVQAAAAASVYLMHLMLQLA